MFLGCTKLLLPFYYFQQFRPFSSSLSDLQGIFVNKTATQWTFSFSEPFKIVMYKYTSRSVVSEILRKAHLDFPFFPFSDSLFEFQQVVLTTSSTKQVCLIKYSVSVYCSGGINTGVFNLY